MMTVNSKATIASVLTILIVAIGMYFPDLGMAILFACFALLIIALLFFFWRDLFRAFEGMKKNKSP